MIRSVLNWTSVSAIVIGFGSYFSHMLGWLGKTNFIQLVALLAIVVAILDIACALRTRQIFLRGVAFSLGKNRSLFFMRMFLSFALLAAGAYGILYAA